MYRKILSDPLRFPDDMGSEARSLLTQLLNRDPTRRLGVNGAQEIKGHPFFAKHIDFKKLWAKKIPPPFKPAVVRVLPLSRNMYRGVGMGVCLLRGELVCVARPGVADSAHRMDCFGAIADWAEKRD